MEDMRPIPMDHDPGRIISGRMAIPRNMLTLIDNQDGKSAIPRKLACEHSPGEACADNEDAVHGR